jgi:hypothetical protein
MLCPTCANTQLVIAERSGVEIDYCPKCRGVWLDRGELDKLIDRAAAMTPSPQQLPPHHQATHPHRRSDSVDDDDDDYRRRTDQPAPYRKRKGWLGELLDFD